MASSGVTFTSSGLAPLAQLSACLQPVQPSGRSCFSPRQTLLQRRRVPRSRQPLWCVQIDRNDGCKNRVQVVINQRYPKGEGNTHGALGARWQMAMGERAGKWRRA